PVELDQGQPEIAAAGETAFTPQLHQHGFAVRLVGHQLQAAVDVLAIRTRGEEQEINGFTEQRGRDRCQQVDEVYRVEFERHGVTAAYSGQKTCWESSGRAQ